MLIPLLNNTYTLVLWVPDASTDGCFSIEGSPITWTPQSGNDVPFIVNGDPPAEPAWTPASDDLCFTVTGTYKLFSPVITQDLLFIVAGTGGGAALTAAYPLAESAVCQSYRPANDGVNNRLTSITLELQRHASWEGTVQAEVYAHTGTYGTDGLPTGSPLAVSEILTENDIATTATDTDFVFSGINQIILTPNTPYVFVVKLLSTNSVSPALTISYDITSPVKTGNAGRYTNT